MQTQKEDGSWYEPFYTGTGFPRVFYLKYTMYYQYFPLLALTAYAKVVSRETTLASSQQLATRS
jgi:squalene-hopene/tetraprenyl-beta-curcumene cyclase